ncbi:AAA-ATPase [Desulfamplus magnetovallimortis]|uniref:AAA-ATPase n=1 Tax=Desulfamplus magnetovallimortis TaxID=1246637 RepID=A0A1W1H7Y2_9BACT|nr:ATP-binding protein [Desulfamplus magnetovallimortis]SLM28587.1 AAA-ATPase [Desulfamplus magnetovallimortis]
MRVIFTVKGLSMNNLPTLPTGNSSFENIRLNGDIYVDKTRYIYNMVNDGKYYFLSRPRRFGKSLMISTLKCLFEGKKKLFEGLWLENNNQNITWDWKKHPVITLDFNEISHETPEILIQSIEEHLIEIASSYDIELKRSFIKGKFKELILSLNQKTGMPVVFLIDEYDKPLIDHLGKGDDALLLAKRNRDILKDFFGVIKGVKISPVTRFVFITGVSKFSQVSIFSELNNLTDLTMHQKYAEMTGYTDTELKECFSSHIDSFAHELSISPCELLLRMKQYYNGYRFSEKDIKVYNPFSVLRAFGEQALKPYWFASGTPSFLINLIKEKRWYIPEIEKMSATISLFSAYDLETLHLEAILFQAGYITIKDIRGMLYTFDYPNQEVKTAFLENLFYTYTEHFREASRFALLCEYLELGELDNFIETMKAIYASIPNILESKRDEAYFHTIFYLMVSASGIRAQSEVLTCKGRIDMVVEFTDMVYILEFKCNQSSSEAIRQIRDKNYAHQFLGKGKAIYLMGINFDNKERNISDWKHELL